MKSAQKIYKELFFISLDEELAKASGVRTARINLLLIILAAVTVSLSMRIVGVLLIGALMVIPVLTSMQWRTSFLSTFVRSIILSLGTVIAGLFLSYYFDLASGGTIVVLALLIFGVVYFVKK